MRCSLLTLSCYVDDELEARRRGEMEAHLVACARCRAGLTHLEEEAGRIGSLAPVSVPDGSARSLMEAVGVLRSGDAMPPRTTPPAFPGDHEVPPWLAGQAGPALPWTAPPRQPRALSVAHEEAPIHLHGTMTPLRRDEFGGVPAVPFDMEQLRAAPPTRLGPGAHSRRGRSSDSASTPAGDEDASPPSPADRRTETLRPPPSTSRSGQFPHRPSAAGDIEVAVWTSETSAGAPSAPEYATTDEDVLETQEPVEDRGGPVPAPLPGLFERFKDRIAVRRALSGAFHDDVDDSFEVVSGAGAPLRTNGRADLGRRRSDALRPAEPLAGTIPPPSAARRISGTPMPVTRPQPGLREVLAPPARPSSLEPVRPASTPPAARVTTSVRGIVELETLSSRPGREPWTLVTPVPEEMAARAPRGQAVSPSDARDGRRALTLAVGGLAAIMIVGLVSGRTTTRIPTPRPSTEAQAANGSTAQLPSVSPGTEQQQPTTAVPRAGAAAPAPASQQPAPAPAAVPPVGPATIGSGGTGWKVDGFRFGGHTTFYRVVIDIGPSGAVTPGSSPSVSVANEDPTHILVTLNGTEAADTAPSTPAQSWITDIRLVSRGLGATAVYRFTLAHPATAHPILVAGPLRLIMDISQ